MIDCGTTSHIINEMQKFTRFDETSNPEKHYMELADGSRRNNMALKCGDAEVVLRDIKRRNVAITLNKALFIPTYPQSIVSVKAATTGGAKEIFEVGQHELITKTELYSGSMNTRYYTTSEQQISNKKVLTK